MKQKLFIYFLLVIIILSCSSKKSVVYLQDISEGDTFKLEFNDYKIQVDDVLKIELKSENQELISAFNQTNSGQVVNTTKE